MRRTIVQELVSIRHRLQKLGVAYETAVCESGDMWTLTVEQARLMRAGAQGIGGARRAASVVEVMDQVFAVQAQDATAAALGLRVRARDLTAQQVTLATEIQKTVVRGWFMRGTLHLVPAADLHWLNSLFGPLFLRRSARRHRELGLDETTMDGAERVIVAALAADGPMTRGELTARLASTGLDVGGQVPAHLVRRCALRGLICHGPTKHGEASFVLLDDWLPAPDAAPSGRGDAAAELARRYLAAHAPAGAGDFAAWSGLPMPTVGKAWRDLIEAGALEGEVDGQRCLIPGDAVPRDGDAEPVVDVRLLPAYDNYLLGYRNRALSVDPAFERQVWPGGGQIRPTVAVDGRACATWGRRSGIRPGTVTPFEPLTEQVAAGIAAEQADVDRFLGS